MNKNDNLAKRMIESANKIAIFGHMSPDGDCIGAMLGLGKLLEKQKKRISYFVPNKPSKGFDFVKGIKRLKSNFDYKNYDLLIFVDFTGIDRMGIIGKTNPDYFKQKPIVVFDHHLDGGLDHSIMIKDTKSISACEILFEYTYAWRPKLFDKDIATYFYLGITSDSGNFLFGEDHIRTFNNAVKLFKLGADKDFVVDNLIRKKSLNSIKFLQLLLSRIDQKEELLYTYYDEEEIKKYNIDPEEASYGLHIIQNIDGPQIVLLIRKMGDYIKGSIRAKNIPGKKKINCNIVASTLGGGGHKLAAGFGVPAKGEFEQQIKEIVKHINKTIKEL
ncbi:MAG: bifunctional oligoribonuclease/PAP phosphatase NrnA [Candidatus Absconditabacterales bacterium]